MMRTRTDRRIYRWLTRRAVRLGDLAGKITLLWFVYQITGSPMDMVPAGALQSFPLLAFRRVIGICLDRLPQRPLVIAIDLMRAAPLGSMPVGYVIAFVAFAVCALLAVTLVMAGTRLRRERQHLDIPPRDATFTPASTAGLALVAGPWTSMFVVNPVAATAAAFAGVVRVALRRRTDGPVRPDLLALIEDSDMASAAVALIGLESVESAFGAAAGLRGVGLIYCLTALLVWVHARAPRRRSKAT